MAMVYVLKQQNNERPKGLVSAEAPSKEHGQKGKGGTNPPYEK